MPSKKLIMGGMVFGSMIGGYLPFLWGDYSLFSGTSIILTLVGGALGIWLGYKIGQML